MAIEPASAAPQPSDVDLAAAFHAKHQELVKEIHSVVVGQDRIIRELLTALFARGHALIIGVPGLAKTLLVKTLAQSLGWEFKRIQFTPDLMPSDITGTEILQTDRTTGERVMTFVKGPLFANLILADEINRTPPKTQAALLEAMQEYTVTAAGETFHLEPPFFVMATQNPIEHEGTYPLPEAQLDRFMFSINIGYPQRDEEIRIVEETTTRDFPTVRNVFTKDEVMRYQSLVRRVPVSRHVMEYAIDLARASRPREKGADPFVDEYVEWGAGPRASQYLILGAKVIALFDGKPAPSCDDVRAVALPVLQHRIIPNYRATGEGVTPAAIIERLIRSVKEPDYKKK
ncbi:MAG: MoxR family ATPase [Candidatus Hydrogenedentes bacterium]|nr:MoxR family ATPase [Candidatus Hydrogenedentota bacterium]